MRRIVLLSLALLFASACYDNGPLKERRLQARVQVPNLSVAARRQSTVCAGYRRHLIRVKTLRATPLAEDRAESLRIRELKLNAIIADACE